MGQEVGVRFKREGIHVSLRLIHVEIWQKTTKFCEAIILQLKKKALSSKLFMVTWYAAVHGVAKGEAWLSNWTTFLVKNLSNHHYSNKERKKVKVKLLRHVRLFATSWPVAHQAPPSTGFSRQEYWRELPFPSPGDLPDPGIEPVSPALQADALPSEPPVIWWQQ